MSDPVSVLFVCLGNICRSPIADACFQDLTKYRTKQQHKLISEVDSCGTGAYHTGDNPDPRSMDTLRDHGITQYKHKARKIQLPDDFINFDYILAMDQDNLSNLRDMARRCIANGQIPDDTISKIHLYGEFGKNKKVEEIDDPYYGGSQGFEHAFEQATRFGTGLLEHIEKQASSSENKI